MKWNEIISSSNQCCLTGESDVMPRSTEQASLRAGSAWMSRLTDSITMARWCLQHGVKWSTFPLTVFRIRIHWFRIRIRIQHFRLNTNPDPDPGFWRPKIEKNGSRKIFFRIYLSKTAIYLSICLHKGRPSYREHQEFQNMKFLNFFLFLWVIFALLDPIRIPNQERYIQRVDAVHNPIKNIIHKQAETTGINTRVGKKYSRICYSWL